MTATLRAPYVRVPLIYFIFGILWILFSDRLLAQLMPDLEAFVLWQTYKGWAFVLLSTFLIAFFLFRAEQRSASIRQSLRESERRFRSAIEMAPFPIMLHAEDGEVLTLSYVWEEISGYGRQELPTIAAWTARAYGDEQAAVRTQIASVFHSKKRVQEGEFAIRCKDGSRRIWEFSSTPLGSMRDGRRMAISMAVDVTERNRVQRRLQAYAQRLEVLHAIDRSILAHDSSEKIAQSAVDHLAEFIQCERVSAGLIDPQQETVTVLAVRSGGQTQLGHGVKVPFGGERQSVEMLKRGEIRAFTDLTRFAGHSSALAQLVEEGLRSYITVPLIAGDRLVGTLSAGSAEAHRFGEPEQEFIQEVADQLAIALRQNQLYEAEQAQRRLAEALRDTALNLSRTTDLEEIYEAVLPRVLRISGGELAHFSRPEGQMSRIVYALSAGRGVPAGFRNTAWMPDPALSRASGQPLIVNGALSPPSWSTVADLAWIRSILMIPVMLQGRLLGVISVADGRLDAFDEARAAQLKGFAEQMAVAIERTALYDDLRAYAYDLEQRVAERTARLEEQYRQRAVLEERQRLARELHDVVSQALFSASVTAEALPRLWERNPAAVREGLAQLQQLTRGALAEMRTLLLELRPVRLTQTPLGDLLKYLADSLGARLGIDPAVEVDASVSLPEPVHHTFFRIAQEATNNIARHAHPESVTIALRRDAGGIRLRIEDDGAGFDRARVPPDHFGLNIMEERAENVDATLTVRSEIGQGTVVELFWLATE